MARTAHRRGSHTKDEIREVALELFTEQGYEATSLREIAERLGITKAALYYHFPSKDDIVRSLFDDHLTALEDLVAWAEEQQPTPQARSEVIDRMLALASGPGRMALRFAFANRHVVKELHPGRENAFDRLGDLFAALTGPDATVEEALRVRVALLSVNITYFAAQGLDATDEQITAAARNIAYRLNPGSPQAPADTPARPQG